MVSTGEIPYYKNIWQTMSLKPPLPEAVQIQLLEVTKSLLMKGINIFKPYSVESYVQWKRQHDFNDERLQQLVQRLSKTMNLHTFCTWDVLCNYLMYEYHGKIADLKHITLYYEYLDNFVSSMWYFYTCERMFALKAIRFVLENYDSNLNASSVFGKYVDIVVPDIFRSLLKQLQQLINEISASTFNNCLSKKHWADRNNREQLEVVACLIVAMKYIKLDMTDYISMINLFKEHNFTNQPSCYKVLQFCDGDIVKSVRYAEISACLVGLLHCWDDNAVWINFIEQLDAVIAPLMNTDDHAVLLLAWATLQTTLPVDAAEEAYNQKYHAYVTYAFQFHVLHQMYEITTCEKLMENDIGRFIRLALYKLLQQICNKFDSNGEILNSKSSCRLVAEIIKEPTLAADCFTNSEEGVALLYNQAMRTFPFNFASVTYIYTTLASYPKHQKRVYNYLLNMPTYTEDYGVDTGADTSELRLLHDYDAQYLDHKCPKNTKAVLWKFYNKILLTLKHPCNYFVILKNVINEVLEQDVVAKKSIETICSGYELLSAMLNMPEANAAREVQNCLKLISPLLLKFAGAPFKNRMVANTLFKICTKYTNRFDETLLSLLLLHKFLPTYAFALHDITFYQNKECLKPGIMHEFVLEERNSHEYDLLITYLKFVNICVAEVDYVEKVQLPGLIYIIHCVFTKHENWLYKHKSDRHVIGGTCLNIFFNILRKNPAEIEGDKEKRIYDFCKASFVNNMQVMKAYMQMLQFTNMRLNLYMHEEINWKPDNIPQVYRNVKLALSIFVNMLNNITIYEETLVKCVFPNDKERRNFSKIIAGYIQQIFDETIAEISVIILRKVAQISGLPMLSSLDMDYSQIQGFFLYRLRDPLVSLDLKITLIDFITTCIHSQNALTAALFNIAYDQTGNWTKKPDPASESGESVQQFLVEYLSNFRETKIVLYNTLRKSVLNLLHNIWLLQKDVLIEELIFTDFFWSALTDPLIKEHELSVITSRQIFQIMSLELVKCRNRPNEYLKSALKSLFNEKGIFIEPWCNRLSQIIDESDDIAEDSSNVLLLCDWAKLIIISLKIFPDAYVDPEIHDHLLDTSISGLRQHFNTTGLRRVVSVWIELYYNLITIQPDCCKRYVSTALSRLTAINHSFSHFYGHFTKATRSTFIGAVFKTAKIAEELLTSKPDHFYEYFNPIGKIMNLEYRIIFLRENEPARLIAKENDRPWILLCHLINYLVNLGTVENFDKWLLHNRILPLVLGSLNLFIDHHQTLHTAKSVVTCITNFAYSQYANCFLDVKLIDFYGSIEIHFNSISFDEIKTGEQQFDAYVHFWQTYRGIILTNSILLKRFGPLTLDSHFAFISLYTNLLRDILRLPYSTADINSLKLVHALINYCLLLLNWEQYWHLDSHRSFISIMDGLKESFNACLAILLRSRTIFFFKLTHLRMVSSEHISHRRMKDIMELVIDIIICCCKCFMKYSVNTKHLLNYYNTGDCKVIVENDFSVPKLQLTNNTSLNFGSLLCTLHFLCKCTYQINNYKLSPDTCEPIDNPKDTGEKYAAFVSQDSIIEYTLDKFNIVPYFITPETTSSMSPPWLCFLSEQKIEYAIESVATFLVEQVQVLLNNNYIAPQVAQCIRRELCSELQTFHEFIRKKLMEVQIQKDHLQNVNESSLDITKSCVDIKFVNYISSISQWFTGLCDTLN